MTVLQHISSGEVKLIRLRLSPPRRRRSARVPGGIHATDFHKYLVVTLHAARLPSMPMGALAASSGHLQRGKAMMPRLRISRAVHEIAK